MKYMLLFFYTNATWTSFIRSIDGKWDIQKQPPGVSLKKLRPCNLLNNKNFGFMTSSTEDSFQRKQ